MILKDGQTPYVGQKLYSKADQENRDGVNIELPYCDEQHIVWFTDTELDLLFKAALRFTVDPPRNYLKRHLGFLLIPPHDDLTIISQGVLLDTTDSNVAEKHAVNELLILPDSHTLSPRSLLTVSKQAPYDPWVKEAFEVLSPLPTLHDSRLPSN